MSIILNIWRQNTCYVVQNLFFILRCFFQGCDTTGTTSFDREDDLDPANDTDIEYNGSDGGGRKTRMRGRDHSRGGGGGAHPNSRSRRGGAGGPRRQYSYNSDNPDQYR